MDTDEMYQRGVADAERDELHPFYYQHYYHYRRGYDHTRRAIRRANGELPWRLIASIAACILIAAGIWWFIGNRNNNSVASTPEVTATAPVIVATPVRTPLFPTMTPSVTPEPKLEIEASAWIVNTAGSPLRGRQEPTINSPVRATFKEGEQVKILGGPIEADGYTWWQLEGSTGIGWSAERSNENVEWISPKAP